MRELVYNLQSYLVVQSLQTSKIMARVVTIRCILEMACLKCLLHWLIKYPINGAYYLKRATLFCTSIWSNSNSWSCRQQLIFHFIRHVEVPVSKDGNFVSLRLIRPSLLCLAQVFPTPQRWWGGNGTGAKF